MATNWLQPLESKGSLRKTGIRAMAFMGASQGAKLVLNIAATLVLVRLLAPADFGLYAMAGLLLNFIYSFKEMGLSTATIQAKTLTQTQASTLFWLNQLGGLAMGCIALAAAPFLAALFNHPELTPAFMLLSAGFLIGTVSVQHMALLKRNLRFATVGTLEVTGVVTGIATAFIGIYLGWGWYSLIAQRLVQLATLSAGAWLACTWRPSFRFSVSEAKSDIHFGAHVMLSQITGYLSSNADNALIGWYWGATPLGLYSKAYDLLMNPINQISAPVGQVLQPILGRLRDEPARYRAIATHAVSAAFLTLLPVGMLAFWQPGLMTRVVLGESWLAAAPVFGWLGLGMAVLLGNTTMYWLLITQRMGKKLTAVTMLNTCANLLGFLVSLPLGIEAMAATFTIIAITFRIPNTAWAATQGGILRLQDLRKSFLLPLAVAVGLSLLYGFAAPQFFAVLPQLGNLLSLLLLFALGYGLMLLMVLPSPLGRFMLSLVKRPAA